MLATRFPCCLLFCGALVLGSACIGQAEGPSSVEQRLARGVQFLSSDQLGGRGLGTPGIERAAEYIQQEMAAAGLAMGGTDGTPFQPFNYTASVTLGEENRAQIVNPQGDGAQSLELNVNFTPLAIGGTGVVDAPLVFVGYGITAPELEYDDYATIDAAGKVVIVVRHEPQQADPESRFNGTDITSHAAFRTKIQNAIEHGAVAVVFCTGQHEVEKELAAIDKRIDAARQRIADGVGSRARAHREDRLGRLQSERRRIEQGMLGFTEAGSSHNGGRIPVFCCSRDTIDDILARCGNNSLNQWERAVDRTGTPYSFDCGKLRLAANVDIVREEIPVKNVIGVIEGVGPLAEETVVIGAHYDHLGLGNPRSGEGQIHNGADDNASGTIVLLELARRFGQRAEAPPRRLVFVAFTAEEKGLLGSRHYVNNPPFPLDSTVAMLNFDMVGRVKNNQLWVNGVATAEPFSRWLREGNQRSGFSLREIPGGKGPSDHASFCNQSIPVLHFFSGMHPEYHRPGDDFHLVNLEGMRRVCDLAEALIDRVARHPEGLAFVDADGPSMPPREGERVVRPWFGVRVATEYAGDGFQVTEVLEGSPAAAAGVVAGDIIIRLEQQSIAGLDAFQQQLAKRQPGDKVTVTVIRAGQEQTISATLASPPGA